MNDSDTEEYLSKAEMLRLEHRDLDDVIARLESDPNVDDYQLKRLKKRKLHLKDQIMQLENRAGSNLSL